METTWTPCERFWAVGSKRRAMAHRIIGRWPGNDAVQTICGNSLCLHAEGNLADAWGDLGGRSYAHVDQIPMENHLCLKCVEKDNTVE